MSRRFAVAVVSLCGVLAAAGAMARPLFPQPLKWVRSDATGVAAADFNNDGHMDVVAPGRDFHEIRVHLGHGDGTFTTLPEFYVDDCPTGVAAEDFDSDGNVDLALGKFCDGGGVSVLLGNGDGTFAPETDYAPEAQPFSVRVGDFNGDGEHDLIGLGGQAQVLLGNGDGTFVAYQNPGQPYFAGIADFNGDDMDDYAYPLAGSGTVRVELSDGDGTFTLAGTLIVGDGPIGVAAGDVSEDGIPDLIVANGDSNDLSVLFGNGDGSFGAEQRYTLGVPSDETFQPWCVAIEDLDGDGLQDLVVSNWWGGYRYPSISLLYGTGGGQFSAAVAGDVTLGFAFEFALADFNGDGATDLVRSRLNGSFVSWLFGDGHGAFVTNRKEVVGEAPAEIAVGDLDGDGRLDLVTTNVDSDDVSLLLADGAGTFAPEQRFCVVDAAPPCPPGSDPSAVAVVDTTGDGHADLAVANAASDSVSFLANEGDGSFSFISSLDVTPGMAPGSIAVADLDDDADLDVVVVGEGSSRLGVYLSNGDGTFDPPPGLPVGLGLAPTALAVGELDGDGAPDVVVANSGSDTVTVLLGDGDGTFTPAPTLATGSDPRDVTVGDVNGDQIADLAVSSDGDNAVSFYPGNGDGSFGSPTTVQTSPYRYPWIGLYQVRIADLDGDGMQDLTVTTGELGVIRGNGDGTFDAPDWYTLEGSRLVTGDFNLDGRLDVAGNAPSDRLVVLLNQTGAEALTFEPDGETLCWPAATGALSYDIYRGDLSALVDGDGDGLPDGGYGACMTGLDADPRDTFFTDADVPSPAGAGFFYLMDVIDTEGAGGIGTTSAGLPRVPASACP